jgi:integrase
VKFVLLTAVRKSEFIDATWKEIDFAAARWTIPARNRYLVLVVDRHRGG